MNDHITKMLQEIDEKRRRDTKNHEAALSEFLCKLGQCQIELEKIKAAIDNHLDESPDSVNWASVGDAGRLLADLECVAEYL